MVVWWYQPFSVGHSIFQLKVYTNPGADSAPKPSSRSSDSAFRADLRMHGGQSLFIEEGQGKACLLLPERQVLVMI